MAHSTTNRGICTAHIHGAKTDGTNTECCLAIDRRWWSPSRITLALSTVRHVSSRHSCGVHRISKAPLGAVTDCTVLNDDGGHPPGSLGELSQYIVASSLPLVFVHHVFPHVPCDMLGVSNTIGGMFARRAPGVHLAHYFSINYPNFSPRFTLSWRSPPSRPHLPDKAPCIIRQ